MRCHHAGKVRTRRAVLGLGAAGASAAFLPGAASTGRAADDAHRAFIAEAERMRLEAVAAGDQSYGAVLVRDGRIVGWGPSRVVAEKDWNAHAERVAIRDAQARLGTKDLSGAILYSTSGACPACEKAAAAARVARMVWGPRGIDAGAPRG